MCGIAALFGRAPDRHTLSRMLQLAARRGPEGTRMHAVAGGLIAHAALRFVAIGDNEQPLVGADGSTIVWNGEIYNWRQLNDRYELGAGNDTEVLLFGLRSHGAAFLREVDGQFAFVAQLAPGISAASTLLGRDKWGICPLVFGQTPEGWLAVGSTTEVVRAARVLDVKTVPAGTLGFVASGALCFEPWYRLPRRAFREQLPIDPAEVRRFALARVRSRIPEEARALYTTLGGIDSQFVTASVARELGAAFGGAVTVVPWQPSAARTASATGEVEWGGDYPYAKATLDLLRREGVHVAHHLAVVTPELVHGSLDRLLRLLGPDLFHVLCGLAEDLVAVTVSRIGGRAIMTAGGPDEAGRSYDRWTFLHRGLDEELAWHRLAEQFASSDGVRAGLVFGEHGIENRVPLADLIELATAISPEQKQRVHDEGDGLTVASLRMDSKIFWRQALNGLLPECSLRARKQPIHGSTGAVSALHEVLSRDREFATHRVAFAWEAWRFGWYGIVFGDLRSPDPANTLTECQLYALYRWSLLEPELFRCGAEHRYGPFVGYLPRCVDEPMQRVDKPLCYDWQLGCDVPLRAVQ
jgi:asparagine synthetase B (glutamine-hydrolysing)